MTGPASPQSTELCPTCGQPWEEHEFGVPSPYCPVAPMTSPASPQSNDAPGEFLPGAYTPCEAVAPTIDQIIAQAEAIHVKNEKLTAELEQAKRELNEAREEAQRAEVRMSDIEESFLRPMHRQIQQVESERDAVQAQADALRAAIRAIEWSGTAHGAYGESARRCPVCFGMHPHESLAEGGGRYSRGLGHAADCALAAALRGATEGVKS